MTASSTVEIAGRFSLLWLDRAEDGGQAGGGELQGVVLALRVVAPAEDQGVSRDLLDQGKLQQGGEQALLAGAAGAQGAGQRHHHAIGAPCCRCQD